MDIACPVADAFLVITGGDPDGAIQSFAEEQGKAYYAPGDILETAPIVRALFTNA